MGFGEAMQLTLKDNLPFTEVKVAYRGQEVEIKDVLVDTGSATTIFSSDLLAEIDITPLPEDILYTIRGVGGIETVFSRVVDHVQLGKQKLSKPEIEVGGMDYGFEINGILGMDFLTRVGAVINLRDLNISFD
jgi:predicted aspartyl protease